jgi:hypothetical protein
MAPRDCHADEIANRRLEYRKEKSRIADDHRQHGGEFVPKSCRSPNCLPRGAGARRVQVCRNDLFKSNRLELLGVHTEPAKPHAPGLTVEFLGFDKDLERYALQAGRITKMIKISEKILDFEPHDRLTVLAAGVARFVSFVDAIHAGVPRPYSQCPSAVEFAASRPLESCAQIV